jgi:TPR repeat protein
MTRNLLFLFALCLLISSKLHAENAPTATGTGFVVNANGYLITCAHVVTGAKKINVAIGTKNWDANVLRIDEKRDLALLQVNAKELTPLPLANSNHVELGQEARVFGYPISNLLGNDLKVTRGTISGISLRDEQKIIQIDAAVNPGNSGGPLTNEKGEVIGVVNAKLGGTMVTAVGFAVPSNYVCAMLLNEGIDYSTTGDKEKLDGPALVKKVTPSIAFISVWDKVQTSVNTETDDKKIITPTEEFKNQLKKADEGDKDAQFNIGKYYFKGIFTEENSMEAIKWYTKAANQGHVEAQYTLGSIYSSPLVSLFNAKESYNWYLKAANQGDNKSQYEIGKMFAIGNYVNKDLSEAIKWFEKSATQNNILSLYVLGYIYENGKGVIKDYNSAIKCYKKAAELGDAISQSKLGEIYYYGKVVSQNYNESLKWLLKAANQDDTYSQVLLGDCYFYGKGVTINFTESINWYKKAADSGNDIAQFQIGYMYFNGQGIPKDYYNSYIWYNIVAAKTTNENLRKDAVFNRDIVEKKLSTEQLLEAQRKSREWKEKLDFWKWSDRVSRESITIFSIF